MHSVLKFFIFMLIQSWVESQGPTGCQLVTQHETATVTLGTNAMVNVDNTSLVSYGKSCQVNLQTDAKQNLKIQSGFRVLDKVFHQSVVNIGERSTISYTESSQLTVGGRLDLCKSVSISFDASRASIMGKADFAAECKTELYDNSVFRVHEGGSLIIKQSTFIEMYRGASFEVSEWWQHAELDDVKAVMTVSDQSKISLMDRSSLQCAKGSFFADTKVVIKLDAQANFLLKGDMNMTESSQLLIGCQGKFLLGTTERTYDPQMAPCLLFTKKSMTLEIGERAALIIKPGAHCMLIDSVKINDTVTLTADSKDKPYVGCFATSSELISAMGSIPTRRRF
jgi:hypothetical protein